MEVQELKELIESEIKVALNNTGLSSFFKIEWGDHEVTDPDVDVHERIDINGDLVFFHHDSQIGHKHSFLAAWSDFDGHGLAYGEDDDIHLISTTLILVHCYMSLAMRDFKGEF